MTSNDDCAMVLVGLVASIGCERGVNCVNGVGCAFINKGVGVIGVIGVFGVVGLVCGN